VKVGIYLAAQEPSCAQGGTISSMDRANSKFEVRNLKFETNPKAPNSNVSSWFAVLENLNFEFVSDFDIRISDFSMPQTCLVPAMPD
jgi:hypothetical protein